MKNTLAICTLVIALLGVPTAFGQAAAYTDADAYEVYSVLLAARSKAWKVEKLVIAIETVDFPHYDDDKRKCIVPSVEEEASYRPLIDAYMELNEKSWLLQPTFTSGLRYQFVSAASINEIYAKDGEKGLNDFYSKNPGAAGRISLSAVGFNPDKTLALVYMGAQFGGTFHFLRKIDGKWSESTWEGGLCGWMV